MEDEKDRKADAGKARSVVPAKSFTQIGNRENSENREGDDLLNGFELRGTEFEGANAIGGNLEAIFEKGNSPTGEDNFPKRFAAVLEVAVPSKSHKDVRNGKKKNGSHEGLGSSGV